MAQSRNGDEQMQTETDTLDDDGNQPIMDEVEIIDRVYDQVLEKYWGDIRGLENRPKPIRLTSSDATSCRPTSSDATSCRSINARLRDELALI